MIAPSYIMDDERWSHHNEHTKINGNPNQSAKAVQLQAEGKVAEKDLSLKFYSNQTSHVFAVQVGGSQFSSKGQLCIVDVTGPLMETRTVSAGSTISIGNNYRARSYFI